MYITTRASEEKIDSLFASLHFERIRLSDKVWGTAEESMQRLKEEADQTKTRIQELSDKLTQL